MKKKGEEFKKKLKLRKLEWRIQPEFNNKDYKNSYWLKGKKLSGFSSFRPKRMKSGKDYKMKWS